MEKFLRDPKLRPSIVAVFVTVNFSIFKIQSMQ